jgi:hypothetical protein
MLRLTEIVSFAVCCRLFVLRARRSRAGRRVMWAGDKLGYVNKCYEVAGCATPLNEIRRQGIPE